MTNEIQEFIARQDLLYPPLDNPAIGVFDPEFSLQFDDLEEDLDLSDDDWWLDDEDEESWL